MRNGGSAVQIRVAVALLGLLGLLTACGADPGEAVASTTTLPPTPSTATDEAPTTTVDHPSPIAWEGPSTLITVDRATLVAVDLAHGDSVPLADPAALTAELGLTIGRFEGVDLSPDGTRVAFTFGGFVDDMGSFGLFEVPADGSTPPARVELHSPAASSWASTPRYSPDGRLLAVHAGAELQVLDAGRATNGGAIAMPYPPAHLTWTPGGDGLTFLQHYERTSCCTRASVSVDPTTGTVTSGVTNEPTDGSPYFDPAGELRSMPPFLTFDLDASRRYVLSSDGTPGRLEWWDATGTTASPRPVPLPAGLSLGEAAPFAW